MKITIHLLALATVAFGISACAATTEDAEVTGQSEEAIAAPVVGPTGGQARYYSYVCQEVTGTQCAQGHCGCSSSGCGNAGAGNCTSHASCRYSLVSDCSRVAPTPSGQPAKAAPRQTPKSASKQVYTCKKVGSISDCGSSCGDPIGALDQCSNAGVTRNIECTAVAGSSCS
ncbi:MAG: hypothetical protein U0174_28340 [Polyangiaceae bacterium]